MAIVISDRVKETTTTSGTGSLSLGGAVGGFVSFSSGIGVGNTTYYVIENDAKWEIGIGTVSSGSLSRDTVISSSDGGSKVSLSGVSFVFVALPASKTVLSDDEDSTTLLGGLSLLTDNSEVEADNLLIHKHGHINNITSSGDIISSGMLTLTRAGAGSFFHAYKEGVNPTIALYSDASASPEWKLGLKSNPNSSGDPPTYGYIHGEDGNIGLYANDDNTLTLSHSLGLVVKNKGNTIITSSNDNGAAINGQAASYPVLILKSASAQSANIQEWHNSAGTTLSYVDKSGELFVTGNNLLSSINLNSASGAAISGWAADSFGVGSLNMPAASGTHISQNAEDIITVSGIASGVPQNTEDIVTVSGIANAAYTGVGDVSIMQYIYHEGDGDTYIRFRGDQMDFVAGGRTMLTLDEATNDKVIVNDGGQDVDFQVEGQNDANLIRTDAANDRVGIGTDSPSYLLDVAGSGSFQTIRFSDGTTQITAGGGSDANIQVNSASGVDISGYAESYTQLLDRIPHESGYHLLSEIRFNSASGATNLDSILATSGYFDEVLGSGSYLGIIPTAVSGYIDYAIGSGATYTDNSINYTNSVLHASGLDVGLSGIQFSDGTTQTTAGGGGTTYTAGSGLTLDGLNKLHSTFASGQKNKDNYDYGFSTSGVAAIASGQKNKDNYDYGFATSGITYANGADNRIATFTDTNALNGEANLTFDGSTLTYVGYLGSGLTIANDGSINASGDITTSGIVSANGLAVSGNATIDGNITLGSSGTLISSGVSTSGLRLGDYTPMNPREQILYNNGGGLIWGGTLITTPTSNSQDIGTSSKRFSRIFAAEQINVVMAEADKTAFQVKAHASQSADLFSFKNSAANPMARVTSDGSIATSGDLTASGTITFGGDVTTSGAVITSGVFTSGVHLQPIAPALSGYPVTNVLYNDNGTLKFNGSAVGGGSTVTLTAGDGLTGGGDTSSDRTFTVVGGDGITANANDVAITAAQTTITSVYNASLKMGRDAHNLIDFATTDDKVILRAANVDQISLIDNVFGPEADDDVDLGTTAKRWKDAYVDNLITTDKITSNSGQFEGNVQINGPLNGGTTLIMNSGEFGGNVHFAKSINQLPNTITQDDSLTEILNIDCGASNYHEILLTEDVSNINFTNVSAGQRVILRIKQHSSHVDLDTNDGLDEIDVNGSNATVKWAGGVQPVLTEANNAVDVYGFIFESTVTNVMAFIIGQNLS